MKTTNYIDTFIEVAEDCPATIATVPPRNETSPTAAAMQFEMLYDHPYSYSSDDVLFAVFAQKRGVPAHELPGEREAFFSKGQPCMRASPLTKRYGWGVHSNGEG